MINTYKLKLTVLQQEILNLLFIKAGAVLNQRQVARHLQVSSPAIMNALPKLKKEELIKLEQDKESRRWAICLNRNQAVMQLKRADNLRQLYHCGLTDFLEKEFAGSTIVLFGSYSRGEDLVNSDIDIAVIGRKDKQIELGKYEKYLERKININFYDDFKSIHKNLKENLCAGITLTGGFEL